MNTRKPFCHKNKSNPAIVPVDLTDTYTVIKIENS